MDIDGHPVSGARRIHVTWMRGGRLQKFYVAIELDSPVHWCASEIDCNHGICHVHPNGHHPPSGEQRRSVEIMRLHHERDVLRARGASNEVIMSTIMDICGNGGEWSEGTIAEYAESNARVVARAIVDV